MGENGLARAWRRFTSSNAELESEQLVKEALDCGATPLARCGNRSLVTVSGTVASVRMQPRGTTRWLEVELKDGSGTVTLIWMGRRSIPGVTPGSKLKVVGRITWQERRPVMFNPSYEILHVAR